MLVTASRVAVMGSHKIRCRNKTPQWLLLLPSLCHFNLYILLIIFILVLVIHLIPMSFTVGAKLVYCSSLVENIDNVILHHPPHCFCTCTMKYFSRWRDKTEREVREGTHCTHSFLHVPVRSSVVLFPESGRQEVYTIYTQLRSLLD